jgi:hypothetical protein
MYSNDWRTSTTTCYRYYKCCKKISTNLKISPVICSLWWLNSSVAPWQENVLVIISEKKKKWVQINTGILSTKNNN